MNATPELARIPRRSTSVRRALVVTAGFSGIALLGYGTGLPSILSSSTETPSPAGARSTETEVREAYGRLPLNFELNQGQSDSQVKFMARGEGYTLFLTPGETVLSLAPPAASAGGGAAPAEPPARAVLRTKFLGANPAPKVTGSSPTPAKANHFTGADPAGWRTDVPTYATVGYTGLYPGIDAVYHGKKGQLEYDFVVAPGADPSQIRLGFEGARSMAIDDKGDLVLTTEHGRLRQAKPRLYQDVGGRRKAVNGSFLMTGPNQVGFSVSSYDADRPLVIDPVLSYSTFLGGGGSDVGFGIAVDPDGNAYVGGQTGSTNFPTAGATTCPSTAFPGSSYQCAQGGGVDAFVTKLNPAGSALVWSTYLGGGKADLAYRIALDGDGNAYVVGATDSADDPGTPAVEAGFPTTAGAFDTTCGTDGLCNARPPADPASCPAVGCRTTGTSDTFVSKLSASGNSLMYSTFLGGADHDQDVLLTAVPSHQGIAVHGTRAYVTGSTGSDDDLSTLGVNEGFPTTTGAFQNSCGSAAIPGCDNGTLDGYLAVLDTAASGASSLVYSTYLGGSGSDAPRAVAVDGAGNAYVTGVTYGYGSPTANNFPTKSAVQAGYQGGFADAFVAKLDPAGVGPTSLVYSTYLGGGGKDEAWGIDVEGGGVPGKGKAYVTGFTNSGDNPATSAADGPTPYFPTTSGAYDTSFNGRATDGGGNTTFLDGDAFVVKLKATGDKLDYATFLGGADHDLGGAVAVDSEGNAYVTGFTTCQNDNGGVPLAPGAPPPPPCAGTFPVLDAVQPTMDGNFIGFELHNSPTDIFLTKLNPGGSALIYSTYLGGNDFDRGFAVAVRDTDAAHNAITPEAYVTGRIASTNYPTTAGAFKTTKPAGKGNRDAAVSKVVG
ncbi:MAG TPA: SBBP repeat-containing protein [Acidimicrobiales bacterium]|nr:SBBP repeat-containing protein [Acidimicrobiales bacterium]